MFSPDELYATPFHLVAKPLSSWSDAELREQLELYEVKKQRRAQLRRDVTEDEIQEISAMQSLKFEMMREMLNRTELNG